MTDSMFKVYTISTLVFCMFLMIMAVITPIYFTVGYYWWSTFFIILLMASSEGYSDIVDSIKNRY